MNHEHDYHQDSVRQLRADLALALRAAAHFALSEGVCNHFSVELPDGSGRFLLNPRGLMWQEVQSDDIVMVDVQGQALAGLLWGVIFATGTLISARPLLALIGSGT